MRQLGLIAAMVMSAASAPSASAAAAVASDQVSISLSSNNGSVPPPFHRATEIEILAGGHGRFEKRFGYDLTDTSQRFEQRFELSAGDYATLVALVSELRVFATDWREVERPNVGGSSVYLDISDGERRARIPSQLIAEQRAARDRLVAAIQQLVPGSVRQSLDAWSSGRGDAE